MASISDDNGDSISLNIMPMLDIFSILILFLLMSFSTDPVNHDLNEAVELPESGTLSSLDEIPTIVVSKTDISVNGRKVTTLIGQDIQERDISQGAIYPLYNELLKISESGKKFSKDKSVPGSLTIEVDKHHKFSLLKRVMLSAQQANFITFKLMVSKTRE